MGNHELFELASPSNSLVGFRVIGELAAGMLQLKVKMSFGSIESPTKEIPLATRLSRKAFQRPLTGIFKPAKGILKAI